MSALLFLIPLIILSAPVLYVIALLIYMAALIVMPEDRPMTYH